MLLSKAEITALIIIGVYMDAPAKIFKDIDNDFLCNMIYLGYLRYNKSRTTLRLTNAGAEILSEVGVEVKIGVRATGRKQERRLQGSQVALFLSQLGLNIFLEDVPGAKIKEPKYLSTAEIRRSNFSNILGISKFLGILYTTEKTYIIYNVSNPDEKLFPNTEEGVFTREIIRRNVPAEIVYASGDNLEDMVKQYMDSPPAEIKDNSLSYSAKFYQAVDLYNTPVCFVPMKGEGQKQLQIMLTENYRERLAKTLFTSTYKPPKDDFIDALFISKEKIAAKYPTPDNCIIFIDFNVKRLEKALRYIDNLHIFVLEEQLPALNILLNGRAAKTYSISADKVLKALSVQPIKNMNTEPFITEKGGKIIAKKFEKDRDGLP